MKIIVLILVLAVPAFATDWPTGIRIAPGVGVDVAGPNGAQVSGSMEIAVPRKGSVWGGSCEMHTHIGRWIAGAFKKTPAPAPPAPTP